MKKENRIIKNLRYLACSTIHNAKSGHVGICLGAAPIVFSCFKNLKISSTDSNYFNRDRFVMCAGHGGVLDYCMRHMLGYDISVDDLKDYRKFGSKLSAFPTLNEKLGIDATTGPLGQGFAMAVGMAIAETILADRFNKKDLKIVDHFTYCFVSDGCLMEGIANEAASLAGNFKLNKLIVLYDSNNKTIDGDLSLTCNENVLQKFEAMGWCGLEVKNGEDYFAINRAIKIAKKNNKPTIIKINTKIGKCSPLEDKNDVHASCLTDDEYRKTIENLRVDYAEFEIDKNIKPVLKKMNKQKIFEIEKENRSLKRYKKLYPFDYDEFIKWQDDYYSTNFFQDIKNNKRIINYDDFLKMSNKNDNKFSTKEIFSYVFNKLAAFVPNLFSLSADVASRVGNLILGGGEYSKRNRTGRNIFCGVREHAMAGICNGIILHKGIKVFCSTYLTFSDYLKPAIRMSSIMNLGVVYIFSHDSILIGSDGITHQPIEQFSMLRSTPNLTVFRPADFNEVVGSICCGLVDKNPTVIALSKQEVENNFCATKTDVSCGAYFVKKNNDAKINFIGSGSELEICFDCAKILEDRKMLSNIISIPSIEKFEKKDDKYKKKIVSNNKKNYYIELSNDNKFLKMCPSVEMINLNNFIEPYNYENIKDEIISYIGKIK